jgi:Notch-like protein
LSRLLKRVAFVFLPVLALAVLGGCLAKERCYGDSQCRAPQVCRGGRCVLECVVDEDCDASFTAEYVCEENRCRYPASCADCSFPNAQASCVHGDCSMGECNEGFIDLNGNKEDGCEYACTVSNGGVEICDGRDNDCDGVRDEGFDLASDPQNCGACGRACPQLPNADPVCTSGTCTYTCRDGWYDNNGLAADGCEAAECVPAEEICDGRDNDCDCPGDTDGDTIACGPGDAGVDEGFDKTLPETCGPYCIACAYLHAEALCVEGSCRMGDCEEGWHDVDGLAGTGCEYGCTETGGGIEICDGLDNDCDGEVDEGGVCGITCPPGMVGVGTAYCIDRYEASRPDATADSAGIDESSASSRPGVMPWIENPMSYAAFEKFQSACTAAGKRMCTKEEWFLACTGPAGHTYVFGDVFDREICNCVDTFCDDYCAEHGISPCSTGDNCGYTYNCFHAVPTGQFSGCTNEYGTFDIVGNAWEIVPSTSDARGYEVRGGAFNCAYASTRLQCTFNAGWYDLFAGFRCCADPL